MHMGLSIPFRKILLLFRQTTKTQASLRMRRLVWVFVVLLYLHMEKKCWFSLGIPEISEIDTMTGYQSKTIPTDYVKIKLILVA